MEINVDLQVQRLTRFCLSDAETECILYREFTLLKKYVKKEFRSDKLTQDLNPHAQALWNHKLTHNNSKKNKITFCHFPSLICEVLFDITIQYELEFEVSKAAGAALEYLFEENKKEYIQQIRYSGPSCKYLHEFKDLLQFSIENYKYCVKIIGDELLVIPAINNLIALKLEVLERYTDAIERFESN